MDGFHITVIYNMDTKYLLTTKVGNIMEQTYPMSEFLRVFEKHVMASTKRDGEPGLDPNAIYDNNIPGNINYHCMALAAGYRCGPMNKEDQRLHLAILGHIYHTGCVMVLVCSAVISTPCVISLVVDWNANKFDALWAKIAPSIPQKVVMEAQEYQDNTGILCLLLAANERAPSSASSGSSMLVQPKRMQSRRRFITALFRKLRNVR